MSCEGVELVDLGAGHPERQPREDAAGQDDEGHQHGEHDARVERGDADQQPAGGEHGADHDRGDDQHPPVLQADHGDQAHGEDADAGAEQRHLEELVVQRPVPRRQVAGSKQQSGHGGVEGGQQRHGDAGLGLALRRGEYDATDDQQGGDHGCGDSAEQALALEEQRQGAEAEQDAARAQRRTTPGCRLPRLELVLHDIGHRLDDVVVDARRLVVDAGGHREQAAVLDALHGQAGVVGQAAAFLGHQAITAVDRGGVEQADRARELGDQLRHGNRPGQHEIHATRSGGDGHPDQTGAAAVWSSCVPLASWFGHVLAWPLEWPAADGSSLYAGRARGGRPDVRPGQPKAGRP